MFARCALLACLVLCCAASGCVVARELRISNSVLSIGVDLSMGGGISWLSDNNRPTINLINTHDEGRYIQQSYYSGPDPYRNQSWSGNPWPWNPIGSGDAFGNRARILSASATSTEIYVKSIPLQWASNNVSCNCTFETWIRLPAPSQPPNSVHVRCRLDMYRYDRTSYGPYGQEFPATYFVGALNELWSYTGSAPWTGGSVARIAYPIPGPPWSHFTATESWAAFTTSSAESHYGVGVLNPVTSSFLGGFHGTPGSWSTKDDATGYIAPNPTLTLPAQSQTEYCFAIAIGYLTNIRGAFASLRSSVNCFNQTS